MSIIVLLILSSSFLVAVLDGRTTFPSLKISPYHLIPSFGSLLFMCIYLLIKGIKDVKRHSSRKNLKPSMPRRPWSFDYPWNRQYSYDQSFNVALEYLVAPIFISCLIWPFIYGIPIAFAQRKWGATTVAIVIFGAIMVLLLIFTIKGVYLLLRMVKYGIPRVELGRFPFFLGEPMDVYWQPTASLVSTEVDCRIRFIQEQYESPIAGTRSYTERVVCRSIYSDSLKLKVSDRQYRGGAPELLKISFDLPKEDCSTNLVNDPASYWELDISIPTSGINYGATFLLPVYRRS